MASSVILRNLSQLNKSLQKNIDYVDLNYIGYDKDKTLVLKKGSPILNRYKIWLQSKSTDYTRNAGFGGFFQNNLNEYEFSSSSETQIEADLRAKTEQLFPDLNLISVEVKCMAPAKYWNVKVVVSDKMTGLVGADMVQDGQNIVFTV